MIVNHKTREVVAFVTVCVPDANKLSDSLFALCATLAGDHGIEKRSRVKPSYPDERFSSANIWLKNQLGYDFFLSINAISAVPSKDLREWENCDGMFVLWDNDPKRKELSRQIKIRAESVGYPFPVEYMNQEDFTAKAVMPLLKKVESKLDQAELEEFTPLIEIDPPSAEDLETRAAVDSGFWLEDAMMQFFKSQPVPRDQHLYVEELRRGFPYIIYLPERGSFYDFAINTIIEPRSFELIAELGYRRLYHLARRRAHSRFVGYFFGLLHASGRGGWINDIEHEQGGTDVGDLLYRLAHEKLPLPAHIALGAVVVSQHFSGKFKTEDIQGRQKQLLISGTEELLKKFDQKPKITKVKEVKDVYEFLKLNITKLKDANELRAAYYLALVAHQDPTPFASSLARLFPEEQLLQSNEGDPSYYNGAL